MNRKGISANEALVILVIVGVTVVVLALLYTTIYDLGQQEFSQKECQLSLQLTRAADRNFRMGCFNPVPNPTPLKCSRSFLTVTHDDVRTTDKSVLPLYDSSCPTGYNTGGSCLAQNVVAQEMAKCWDTFFEGEMPVFQQVEEDVNGFLDIKNFARACFVCAEVTLRTGADITDFRDGYLKQTNYNRNKTFYEFLAKNPLTICPSGVRERSDDATCYRAFADDNAKKWYEFFKGIGAQPLIDQSTLVDGNTYAIIFMRQGMHEQCGEKSSLGEQITPAMSVQAIPANEIARFCDTVLV